MEQKSTMRWGAVLAPVLLAAACGSAAPPVQPRAAQSLGCSAQPIQAKNAFSYNEYVQIVEGCGKKDILDLSDGKWNSLRERAAFELSCPADALEVTILSSDTYGVSGCDQKAVYKWVVFVGLSLDSHSNQCDGTRPARKKPAEAPKQ